AGLNTHGSPSDLNTVHGLENFFVLHTDVKREFFALFRKQIQNLLPRFGAFRGIHQDNHGKKIIHQLLADIEDVDSVFRQNFGNIVHDADAVFTDDGDD
ncbi:hypothetical protein MM808_31750, partial [Klebsiella pneumoniae]|nr:hypothetical protein [Klebsiella pneumoniae]